ncbi:DUF1311 domain-containing protein [Xanthobacter dioxanivorans]|uniref:DUF1311 domain-containing protein n=1 Tax=Xanthobacter dioxanivorans TaxID=2528964 RepID=A0A974PJY9_9HYPH|nr:lysozyme inhibitor LprI family protein [Xanthobacter dioxanivorans]QRG04982.1 DUF1311 domain-containing protein [Xanthobacter dioxanivorans]
MIRTLGLGLLLLLAVPAGVQAEASDAAAVVSRCLEKAENEPLGARTCIDTYANACLDEGRDPSTSGEAGCYRREAEAWDARLNADYKALMARLPKEKAAKLRESERAWIEARKTTCGFYSAFHDGGSMAQIMSAACYNRHTAERALFLKGFMDNAADAGQ